MGDLLDLVEGRIGAFFYFAGEQSAECSEVLVVASVDESRRERRHGGFCGEGGWARENELAVSGRVRDGDREEIGLVLGKFRVIFWGSDDDVL